MPENEYAQPVRDCDVVMKGGITSGIVYPKAVCELARTYRFHSIGGTSAGAIAAAATAAAEYGRRNGRPESFKELEGLPELLGAPAGKGSKLFSLFQPQPETAPIFNTLVAGLGKGRKWKIALAALANFLPAAMIALLACGCVAFAWLAFSLVFGGVLVALSTLPVSALLTVIVVATAVTAAILRRVTRAVPENFYGLCTGYADPATTGDMPPLTTWLSDLLNRLAGKPREEPLTFGDLWGPGGAEKPESSLQMMTTNLSHGRPYRLPFTGRDERIFFFDPDEFRKLFPREVVDWMVKKSRPEKDEHAKDNLLPLPAAADLPVVVGARMSLSFPFLISAVPLHAIDYGRPRELQKHERCWFSDGGICSNFPVHFFDAPLPRWPTFAINLRPYHRDFPARHIYKAETNGGGLDEAWWPLDGGSGFRRLKGFFDAINNAMQNWGDNMQLRLPGYRDRVVHVSLSEAEGGLNLNMPGELIRALGDRGRDAAALLALHFGPGGPVEVTWDNHRWVRYRTMMALLDDQFARMRRAFEEPRPGDRPYADLIRRGAEEPPAGYRWANQKQRDFAVEATEAIARLAREWQASGETFGEGAPKPMPELRVRPRI